MATDTVGTEVDRDEGDVASPLGDLDRRRAAFGLAGVVAFVLVWWVTSLTQASYVLPSPAAVATSFYAEAASGEMAATLFESMLHWVPGAVAGTLLGVGTGIALGWSRLVDDVAAPVVRLLRPVPPLALIGFAIAWFGINHTGAAFIIAVGAFWINFYAAYGGVEGVSEDLLDVARSLGVEGDVELIRTVVIPAALPEITTGMRTAIGRSWMLVVAAEIFGVDGIGRRIDRASGNLQVDVVITYILVLSLVFLLVDTGFRAVQRRVLAWQ
jgi:NitT/TauT family transport system permease protein